MKINLHTAFLLVFALLFTLALSSPIEEVESETEDLEERSFKTDETIEVTDPESNPAFDIRSPEPEAAAVPEANPQNPQSNRPNCPKPDWCFDWDFRECKCRRQKCPKPNDCRDWDFRECKCRRKECPPKPNNCRDWDWRECKCRKEHCPKPDACRDWDWRESPTDSS
ncbi:hypothetical protein BJX62DRAFT_238238 [Aspergillus germanicus]